MNYKLDYSVADYPWLSEPPNAAWLAAFRTRATNENITEAKYLVSLLSPTLETWWGDFVDGFAILGGVSNRRNIQICLFDRVLMRGVALSNGDRHCNFFPTGFRLPISLGKHIRILADPDVRVFARIVVTPGLEAASPPSSKFTHQQCSYEWDFTSMNFTCSLPSLIGNSASPYSVNSLIRTPAYDLLQLPLKSSAKQISTFIIPQGISELHIHWNTPSSRRKIELMIDDMVILYTELSAPNAAGLSEFKPMNFVSRTPGRGSLVLRCPGTAYAKAAHSELSADANVKFTYDGWTYDWDYTTLTFNTSAAAECSTP